MALNSKSAIARAPDGPNAAAAVVAVEPPTAAVVGNQNERLRCQQYPSPPAVCMARHGQLTLSLHTFWSQSTMPLLMFYRMKSRRGHWMSMGRMTNAHARTKQSTILTSKRLAPPAVFIFLFLALLLSSFWTSRGHKCRPFSPPVLAFSFLSRIGFSNLTARRFFIECCYLTLSRSRPP